MVRVTRISGMQLIKEFGTNKAHPYTNEQLKSNHLRPKSMSRKAYSAFTIREKYPAISQPLPQRRSNRVGQDKLHKAYSASVNRDNNPTLGQLLQHTRSNLVGQDKPHMAHSTFANTKKYPVIVQPSPHTRNNRVGQYKLHRIPFTMARPNVMNSTKNPSLNHHINKSQNSQRYILEWPKLRCFCLAYTALFCIGVAAATIVILALQVSNSTTIITTTITTTTTALPCNASSSYSDPCNSNPPTSKYIFNSQVNCRRDATTALVLGYRFNCGNYTSCFVNSDCGQDGYCDQYCTINSCSGIVGCNQGLGNCAKLATGLNCGVALSN